MARTAHKAAASAMAEALRDGTRDRCGVCDERDLYNEADYSSAAERALASLVASPDVRAALVEVAHFGFDGETLTSVVDAILAALAPEPS